MILGYKRLERLGLFKPSPQLLLLAKNGRTVAKNALKCVISEHKASLILYPLRLRGLMLSPSALILWTVFAELPQYGTLYFTQEFTCRLL